MEQILSYSFPANNLFLVSLVKTDQQINPYVFMLTLAPGVVKNDKRSYDFNSKITLKVQIDKVLAFARYLIDISKGINAPQYSLVSDPSKTSFGTNQSQMKYVTALIQERNGKYYGMILFRQGEVSKGTQFHIKELMAVGLIIEKMALKALDYAFTSGINRNNPVNRNIASKQTQNPFTKSDNNFVQNQPEPNINTNNQEAAANMFFEALNQTTNNPTNNENPVTTPDLPF